MEATLKKPNWLPWSRKEPADSKAETLKKVRRRTDQKIRQQDAQKEQRDVKPKGSQSERA